MCRVTSLTRRDALKGSEASAVTNHHFEQDLAVFHRLTVRGQYPPDDSPAPGLHVRQHLKRLDNPDHSVLVDRRAFLHQWRHARLSRAVERPDERRGHSRYGRPTVDLVPSLFSRDLA